MVPNTLGIAKKGTLAKTGIPNELAISSGAISVITKKRSYFISMLYGIEVLSTVGGIELA